MNKQHGKVIIDGACEVWPHELLTAEALAKAGYIVEFIPKSNVAYNKTPDVHINGIRYEMKSPTSSHLSVVDKNVKKALSQSTNIVFDSKRMKNAKDAQVLRELEKSIATRRKLKSIIFVDKRRAVHRLK